jgi:transposase
VTKTTIANITNWPPEVIEAIRVTLKGGTGATGKLEDAFEVVRSCGHGHVASVLGTIRNLGLDKLISARPSKERELVIAMIASRIITPESKLATSRSIGFETGTNTLNEELGLGSLDEEDLYRALDWLGGRQSLIQQGLVKRHLQGGSVVLYDVSSSYFEGQHCPLARRGYSRDHRPDKLQVVYGILCTEEGCPVAVEVFDGNTSDPDTFTPQVEKLRAEYGIERITWVGDRGMITSARIREDLRGKEGLDWITSLRSVEIRSLMEGGALQLTLFDTRDMAEIEHPDYPGERLIVCRNPLLQDERTRKRNELLDATEKQLGKIRDATMRQKRPLRGGAAIALRVGKVIGRYKMEKHFLISISDKEFTFSRNQESITKEQSLDGIYIIRTSVSSKDMTAESAVIAYKNLSKVERAFRCMKSIDLHVRPIHHRTADRVRAHIFLCMLAYYVEWHMRKALAPVLFDDDDSEGDGTGRSSVVQPAKRSRKALKKAALKVNEHGTTVMSFRSLLNNLSSIVKSTIRPMLDGAPTFTKTTIPSPAQKEILSLLAVTL